MVSRLVSLSDWLALPGNSGTTPGGVVIINIGRRCYDNDHLDGINLIIEAPAADATSVTVKLYEIYISDRKIQVIVH